MYLDHLYRVRSLSQFKCRIFFVIIVFRVISSLLSVFSDNHLSIIFSSVNSAYLLISCVLSFYFLLVLSFLVLLPLSFHFLLFHYSFRNVYSLGACLSVPQANVIPDTFVMSDDAFNAPDALATNALAGGARSLQVHGGVDERRADCGSLIPVVGHPKQPPRKHGCTDTCACIQLPRWDDYNDVVCAMQPEGHFDARCSYWRR